MSNTFTAATAVAAPHNNNNFCFYYNNNYYANNNNGLGLTLLFLLLGLTPTNISNCYCNYY